MAPSSVAYVDATLIFPRKRSTLVGGAPAGSEIQPTTSRFENSSTMPFTGGRTGGPAVAGGPGGVRRTRELAAWKILEAVAFTLFL